MRSLFRFDWTRNIYFINHFVSFTSKALLIFSFFYLIQVQLAPVAYGLKKLVASCVIEDDKVSTNDLEEKITAFEDLVQSVDIVSFNKL